MRAGAGERCYISGGGRAPNKLRVKPLCRTVGMLGPHHATLQGARRSRPWLSTLVSCFKVSFCCSCPSRSMLITSQLPFLHTLAAGMRRASVAPAPSAFLASPSGECTAVANFVQVSQLHYLFYCPGGSAPPNTTLPCFKPCRGVSVQSPSHCQICSPCLVNPAAVDTCLPAAHLPHLPHGPAGPPRLPQAEAA